MPAPIVLDEIQRLPALLDEVHRLIERRRWRFALTGSSSRKLRRGGANLLAGQARTLTMHPLTATELGDAFDLARSVRYGQLPSAYVENARQRRIRCHAHRRGRIRAERALAQRHLALYFIATNLARLSGA